MMGIVYNYRVYIRDIDPAFNDIRTYQDIIFLIDKIKDTFFQFIPLQLSMGKTNIQIGTQTLDNSCHFRQSLDAIKNKEDLAPPFGFEIYRVADKVLIIAMQ